MTVTAVACVGPARTDRAYRLKARGSAKAAMSAIATAQLTAQLVRDRDGLANYIAQLLNDSERDVDSVQSTFGSIQPPSENGDDLRDRLGKVLNDAVDTISQMRIYARRHDWPHLLQSAHELASESAQLRPLSELPV